MEIGELTFQETIDKMVVLALSAQDPDSPFPVPEYQDKEAGQRWFIVKLKNVPVGFYSTVWPGSPEIYQFFICPKARRKGVGSAAARLIIRDLISSHGEVSLSAIDNASFDFWCRALDGYSCTVEGDCFQITGAPNVQGMKKTS